MATDTAVKIPAGQVSLGAELGLPAGCAATVIFAHGSGSSRHSPRNQFVAARLQQLGFGTVLADLLTPEEERYDAPTGVLRFDIDLLAARVTAVLDWAVRAEPTRHLPIGLFGASTGAAAALATAAVRPAVVQAVVSRGGRPDLAAELLDQVRAPTLLLVGERDPQVRVLNQQAAARLAGRCEIQVVPGASHLFEEPGALAEVADGAARWFATYLTPPG